MADFDDDDHEAMVLDFADNAVIADAVAPETLKGTLQRITDLPWSFFGYDAILKKVFDTLLNLFGYIPLEVSPDTPLLGAGSASLGLSRRRKARSARGLNSIVQSEIPFDLLERDVGFALGLFEGRDSTEIVCPIFQILHDGLTGVVTFTPSRLSGEVFQLRRNFVWKPYRKS